jgi:hypothetical protein
MLIVLKLLVGAWIAYEVVTLTAYLLVCWLCNIQESLKRNPLFRRTK